VIIYLVEEKETLSKQNRKHIYIGYAKTTYQNTNEAKEVLFNMQKRSI